MQKMRLVIYPYSAEFDPVLRHVSLLNKEFEICASVAPAGWGLSGKIITAKSGEKSWNVESDLEDNIIDGADTVFIPDVNATEKAETQIIKEVIKVLPRLRNVICSASLTESNLKLLQSSCEQSDCTFDNLSKAKELKGYEPLNKLPLDTPLKYIDVPIVAIAGLWERSDKFEVSLALREKFIQNNYRITQVGSRNYCEMLGFHSLPDFLFNSDMDAVSKIINFNRWIKQLEQSEKPDIILLTIPGAIKNLNEKFTNGFGVLPHIMLQGVMVDFFVFCTMYDWSSIKLLEEFSIMCRYKYDCDIDCFHMSNMFFDLGASDEKEKVVLNHINREAVTAALEKGFKESPIPIYNIFDDGSCDKIFNLIESKLSGEDFQLVT